MPDEILEIGDFAVHGEDPYTFAYYNRSLLSDGHGLHGEPSRKNSSDPENNSGSGIIMGTNPEEQKGMEKKGDPDGPHPKSS